MEMASLPMLGGSLLIRGTLLVAIMASRRLIHSSQMSIQVSRRIAKRMGILLPSWTREVSRLEEVEADIFRLSQAVSLPIYKEVDIPLPSWAIFQPRKEITRFNKPLRHSQLLVLHGLQAILGPLQTRS